MKEYQIASFSFIIFGIVSLAPWNLVISSLDYYKTKCKYKNFPFVFILPNIAASYLFGFLILFKSGSLSKTIKVYIPLIVTVAFMLLTPGTAYILDQTYGYILFFLTVFFSASLTTLIQMYSLSLSSQINPNLLSFFSLGTGLSGILTSIIRICDLLVLNEGLNDKSKPIMNIEYSRFNAEMVYYAINCSVFVVAVGMFYKCCQFEIFKAIDDKKRNSNGNLNGNCDEKLIENEEFNQLVSEQKNSSICQIVKKQFLYELLILILTTQTFFLFPGFVLKKKLNSVNLDWKNAFFLLVFNCSDTLGKGINLILGNFSKLRLIIFCTLRLILTMPFMLLAKEAQFYLFQCDWFPFLLVFLFGITNGYGFTQIISSSAKLFKQKKDIEIGQYLLFIFFTLGTTIGTFIAFGISKI